MKSMCMLIRRETSPRYLNWMYINRHHMEVAGVVYARQERTDARMNQPQDDVKFAFHNRPGT